MFIHVPNHYKMNWSELKKDPKMSLMVILSSTFFIELFGRDLHTLMLNESLMSVMKGIIMSHVIYEELEIF